VGGAGVVSSRNLSALPAPEELERRCQALAVLEAILCPEPRWRYYAFDAASGPGERVARMDSATGDGWLIWFSSQGVVIRGFDHDSPVSPWRREPVAPWPGLFDGLPAKLRHGPRLEVEGVESVTFCLWWVMDDPGWRAGAVAQPDAEYADPDGSGWRLAHLSGPAAYQTHAQEVHERVVPLEAIEQVYGFQLLTEGLIRVVDPAADTAVALTTARAVGYPVAG
jgi:hypothetical protein